MGSGDLLKLDELEPRDRDQNHCTCGGSTCRGQKGKLSGSTSEQSAPGGGGGDGERGRVMRNDSETAMGG